MAHKTYSEYNDIICTVCGRRWEKGETEPPCIEQKERNMGYINKLRKEHFHAKNRN